MDQAATSPSTQASAFTTLRPPCIALNNSLVAFQRSATSPQEILSNLDRVLKTLTELETTGNLLNERLADYVFFPLSMIFRERARLPVRAVEVALRCLDVLLKTGWRSMQGSDVAIQLLILLTFCADPAGPQVKDEKLQTSEDLRTAALSALDSLFSAVSSTKCRAALVDTLNIPAIGHAITVILDCIKEDQSPSLQKSAAFALHSFISSIATPEVIKSFLPGIVSSLSHILTPASGVRRPYQLLQTCLQILQKVIRSALADEGPLLVVKTQEPTAKDPWLTATAAQMKVALSNIARLRNHDREEVKHELQSLCRVVMDECRQSLFDLLPIVFETLIDLSHTDRDNETYEALEAHFYDNAEATEAAQSYLYDWILSLPRILQSNNDSKRKTMIHRIVLTHRLLCYMDSDMSLIDDLLASNLVEGLTKTMVVLEKPSQITESGELAILQGQGHLITQTEQSIESSFKTILSSTNKHEELVSEVYELAKHISSTKGALPMAIRFLDAARSNHEHSQVLNLWLCISILRPLAKREQEFTNLLDIETLPNEEGLFQELYDFSLSILANSDDYLDNWRLQGLALEGIALQASRLHQSFRSELIDALYPVVDLMGSPSTALRSMALSCLNTLALCCGYDSAQDLLIKNVDYLVNAVGLKITSLDISPQAPQVLLMMTRLCGPVLLPYLDDLVDGIFDALDCFHGYSKLVGLLFSVLDGIVDEASKAPHGRITIGSRVQSHRKPKRNPDSTDTAIEHIEKRRKRIQKYEDEEMKLSPSSLPEETPRRPWAELKTNSLPSSSQGKNHNNEDHAVPPSTSDDKAIINAPTKTYLMVHSIASLTQHHLPSSSSFIRSSILSLLTRAMPYLSSHEDTFLPLINTLWPTLIPRLSDHEAFVVTGVLDVMASMCEGAGDFMASRIEALWPAVKKMWKDVANSKPAIITRQPRDLSARTLTSQTNSGHSTSLTPAPLLLEPSPQPFSSLVLRPRDVTSITQSTPYIATTTRTVRAALTRFLMAVLTHVRVSEKMYFDMLDDMLYVQLVDQKDEKVREALEVVNADAVWLSLERARWNAAGGMERIRLWRVGELEG